MGIGTKMGFGKKEPYKTPREAAALRMKIEAESRENFPHLARYKELAREAEQVYRLLDAEVAKKKYAEEASKVSEDIRKKLETLADRIRKNASEAADEGKSDYVESNIDYLARKSIRNSAKTLFTEFLEGHELFVSTCRQCVAGCSDDITRSSLSMLRTMEELQSGFFSKHGHDDEIRGLMSLTQEKVTELRAVFQQHQSVMRERDAVSVAERHLERIASAAARFTMG